MRAAIAGGGRKGEDDVALSPAGQNVGALERVLGPLVIGRNGPRLRECQAATGSLFAEEIPGQNPSRHRFAIYRHLGSPGRYQHAVDSVWLVWILKRLIGYLDRFHKVVPRQDNTLIP